MVLMLGGLVAVSVLPASSMGGRIERGRDLLVRAQAALLDGDAEAAVEGFSRARAEFRAASRQSGNVLLRAEALIPFAGRTPSALLSLARIGEDVSDAGLEVSRALARLPLGLSSLGLSDGRIPMDALRSMSPALHRARVALEAADAAARDLPASWLLGDVSLARDDVRLLVARSARMARTADELFQRLPTLAGQDSVKRYLLTVQGPADGTPTWAPNDDYGILIIDQGRLSLGPFHSAGTPRSTPRSPTPVDGIIHLNAAGLAGLAEATGPLRDEPELKAEEIWRRFLSTTEPDAALRALVEAAAHGHLIMHASDPSMEEAFQNAGIAGSFGPPASPAAMPSGQVGSTASKRRSTSRLRST